MVETEIEPVGGEELVDPLIGELRPFQLEEEELGGDRGAAFLDRLHQGAVGWVRHIGGEPEGRVRPGSPKHVRQLRGLFHERFQVAFAEGLDLAPSGLEFFGEDIGPSDELVDPLGSFVVNQWFQVPSHFFGVR